LRTLPVCAQLALAKQRDDAGRPNSDKKIKGFTMTTTLKCTARIMSGGTGHEHISHLWWVKITDSKETDENGVSTREQMVTYIEKNGNESVWCPDRTPGVKGAWVHVHNNGRIKYVQTVADNRKTDNLLALPER